MQNTADFIELLKKRYDLKSNYAVAKFLKQTDTAIARWAHGKGSFSDETAIQFADLLDLDPAYVMACIHAERAKDKAVKKTWERMAKRLAAVAAALACVAFLPWDNLSGSALLADHASLALVGFTSALSYNEYYVAAAQSL